MKKFAAFLALIVAVLLLLNNYVDDLNVNVDLQALRSSIGKLNPVQEAAASDASIPGFVCLSNVPEYVNCNDIIKVWQAEGGLADPVNEVIVRYFYVGNNDYQHSVSTCINDVACIHSPMKWDFTIIVNADKMKQLSAEKQRMVALHELSHAIDNSNRALTDPFWGGCMSKNEIDLLEAKYKAREPNLALTYSTVINPLPSDFTAPPKPQTLEKH